MNLFIKDKFSHDLPAWHEIKNEFSCQEILNQLPSSLIKYLGEIKSINLTNALEINSKNFMVCGSKSTIIIKKFKLLYEHELKNKIFVYNQIKRKKLPCPKIIKTNKGFFFKLNNDEFAIALNFIEGRYFNGKKTELKKTAMIISDCFKKTRSIKFDNFEVNKIFPDNSYELIEQFMALLPEINIFNNKDKKFIQKNYNKILFNQNDVLQKIHIFKDIKFEMLHRDLHPHNILIYKDKASLLDLESVLPTKWPIAYGFACFKLLRQFCVKNQVNEKNVRLMRNFIDQILGTLDTNLANYRILFLGAKVEILRRILVIMEENLENKSSLWNSVLKIQIRALDEVDFLENKLI
jgi:hypothetical protein